MVYFIAHWITIAIALGIADWLLSGVRISSWPALFVAALVLGFVNAIVKPILVLLTLPITILTLGLFYFVVNGIVFGLAAAVVPGFYVDSIWYGVLGAIVVSLVSWFIGQFRRNTP